MSDIEDAGFTEVEEHRPGVVQQSEHPQRAVGGDQVEIGHAAPGKWGDASGLTIDRRLGSLA
jgi:hypothetical protein